MEEQMALRIGQGADHQSDFHIPGRFWESQRWGSTGCVLGAFALQLQSPKNYNTNIPAEPGIDQVVGSPNAAKGSENKVQPERKATQCALCEPESHTREIITRNLAWQMSIAVLWHQTQQLQNPGTYKDFSDRVPMSESLSQIDCKAPVPSSAPSFKLATRFHANGVLVQEDHSFSAVLEGRELTGRKLTQTRVKRILVITSASR
ncbi:hypothetical protein DER46DRAFT_567822 [Fusarium sp. MPI-SDFR-AT-0072]|nr:hypothetical protein DER46DRAFT_567822 [Fusarium sp. MPI-SDFR-AT-0072]